MLANWPIPLFTRCYDLNATYFSMIN